MRNAKLAIDGGVPVHPGEPIPLSKAYWDEREQIAIQRVLESGVWCSVYEQATEVKAFEQEFAHEVGTHHAVAFNSGTTAQVAALIAVGVGPGDQVIVPPLTFISTAYTVLLAGAVPVFADVSCDTITIDAQDVAGKITPYTKAVVPVHWLGIPADMGAIMAIAAERDIAVIEDCAHGPGMALNGRPVGSFGGIACWSLQQSKIMTAAGEGGVATTDDATLAARLRQVRDHGKEQSKKPPLRAGASYQITALGNNYRLSEMHAAFARAQLSKLPELMERRRSAFRALYERLGAIPGLEFQVRRPGVDRSYAYFPVLFPHESFSQPITVINAAMHAEGIMTYPMGLDELCHVHPLFTEQEVRATVPAFRFCGDAPLPIYGWGTLPVAEKIADELLLLPLHPTLSEQDLDDIVAATRKVAAAYRR